MTHVSSFAFVCHWQLNTFILLLPHPSPFGPPTNSLVIQSRRFQTRRGSVRHPRSSCCYTFLRRSRSQRRGEEQWSVSSGDRQEEKRRVKVSWDVIQFFPLLLITKTNLNQTGTSWVLARSSSSSSRRTLVDDGAVLCYATADACHEPHRAE